DRRQHAFQREISEAIDAEHAPDFLLVPVRSDQFLARRHVDAVVAAMLDWRGAEPEMDFGRSRLAKEADQAARGRASDQRIVDDLDPPRLENFADRAVLHATLNVATRLGRFDERAADVGVADQ